MRRSTRLRSCVHVPVLRSVSADHPMVPWRAGKTAPPCPQATQRSLPAHPVRESARHAVPSPSAFRHLLLPRLGNATAAGGIFPPNPFPPPHTSAVNTTHGPPTCPSSSQSGIPAGSNLREPVNHAGMPLVAASAGALSDARVTTKIQPRQTTTPYSGAEWHARSVYSAAANLPVTTRHGGSCAPRSHT